MAYKKKYTNRPSSYDRFTKALYGSEDNAADDMRKQRERNEKAAATRQLTRAAKQTEHDLHAAICTAIKTKYPELLFLSDTIAQIRLTYPQMARNKKIQKDGFQCPDIIIFRPSAPYHGLFLEVKKESPFKKTTPTELKKNDHVEGQAKTMRTLTDMRYYCSFVWDVDEAMRIVTAYIKTPHTLPPANLGSA